MFRYTIVFLCAVLVLSNVEFIQAGKFGGGGGSRSSGSSGGRHSYPSSGGLSGSGGHHGYPSSGGLSGNSRGSGYPGGGGGGSHSYPSGGQSHSYPNSGGSQTYPNTGVHKYPPSTGNSGSHSYPSSGSGLSGSNNQGHRGPTGSTTNIHHHYHYSPPQQIQYASPHGPARSYPVYQGTPPSYVYQYKDSGSKYSSLLAGLALFNLGALAGGAVGYGIGHHSSSNNNNNYQNYRATPGEVCIFGIKKDNGDFDETKIDCQLISSFIYAEQAKQQPQNSQNQTSVTTIVTNTTMTNLTNAQDTPSYVLLPSNGTLLPPGAVPDAGNMTNGAPATGGTVTSSVTVTTVNTTVVNAVDVKGSPIKVTPGMECYVMRRTPSSRMKHEVPCGLLQTYADKSIKPNSASRNVPAFTILAVICAVFIVS